MAGGRPTDYTPELLEKAKEYLAVALASQDKAEVTPPNLAQFATVLGIARSTLYAWCQEEDKKEFSDIVEQILAIQEDKLLDGGLLGNYNASIAKLMLTKHGYTDKQETDITSGGKPIPIMNVQRNDSDEEDSKAS